MTKSTFLLLLSPIFLSLGVSETWNEDTEGDPNLEHLSKEPHDGEDIDDVLELTSAIALSYYPELKNTRITFKRKNIKTTMATRPSLGSTFKNRSERTYIIYVDDYINNDDGLLVEDVPFSALIGLIGHEYAHILEYEQMTMWEIVKLGLRYSAKGYKCMLERKTDAMVVERGLGVHLQDWARFAMEGSPASEKYKAYKRAVYMDPHQIYRLMVKVDSGD